MQLEYICSLNLASIVQKRLGNLPKSLAQLYEDIYEQRFALTDIEEQVLIQQTFRILLCTQRELKTEHFIRALSIGHEERSTLSRDDILGICFNFLTLDIHLDTFRFAHLSVQEYLEGKAGYEAIRNHAFVAELSLRHLTFKIFAEKEFTFESSRSYDSNSIAWEFHRYACLYWALHLSKSGKLRLGIPLKRLTRAFCFDRQYFPSDSFVRWNQEAYKCVVYPLSADLDKVRDMISEPADPIFAASVWGFADLVGARAGAIPTNKIGFSALRIAVNHGNIVTASVLIDRGADVNSPDESILLEAVERGQGEMVGVLLVASANPNKVDSYAPLHMAIMQGFLDVVLLLLHFGANANLADKDGRNAIALAADFAQVGIVKVLLDRTICIDPFQPGDWILAAEVQLAAQNGDEASLKTLLNEWSNEAAGRAYLDVVLWHVGLSRHVHVAKLLLDRGADPNTVYQDKSILWGPIFTEITFTENPNLDMFRLIVHAGADIDYQHKNSVLLAKYIFHIPYYPILKDAVQILLDHNVAVNPQGCLTTPLAIAVKNQDVDLCETLLKRGADPNFVNTSRDEIDTYDVEGTMLEIAKNHSEDGGCYQTILDLLKKYGATTDD